MYKILIKFGSSTKNLWEIYGTSSTSTTGSTSFKEFETDDVEVLKEEILILDKEVGFDNIRVISDVSYAMNVDIDSGDGDIEV